MKLKKVFVLWLPMVALGVINGAFRGLVLNRHFDEPTARQISTGTLIVFLTIYVYLIHRRLDLRDNPQALGVGAIWVFLTFIFETLLGYFGTGLSMSEILSEYNIAEGKLWPLVLVVIFLLPFVFYRKDTNRQVR